MLFWVGGWVGGWVGVLLLLLLLLLLLFLLGIWIRFQSLGKVKKGLPVTAHLVNERRGSKTWNSQKDKLTNTAFRGPSCESQVLPPGEAGGEGWGQEWSFPMPSRACS